MVWFTSDPCYGSSTTTLYFSYFIDNKLFVCQSRMRTSCQGWFARGRRKGRDRFIYLSRRSSLYFTARLPLPRRDTKTNGTTRRSNKTASYPLLTFSVLQQLSCNINVKHWKGELANKMWLLVSYATTLTKQLWIKLFNPSELIQKCSSKINIFECTLKTFLDRSSSLGEMTGTIKY